DSNSYIKNNYSEIMMKKINEETIKENWDNIWKNHNNKTFSFLEKIFFGLFKTQFSSKSVYNFLCKFINEKTESSIECGCGSGLIQKKLMEKYNLNGTFLDISEEALIFTKRNISKLNLLKKSEFVQGSILSIPLPDERYDIVWNSGVLEHFEVEDQRKAISEMFRITKKGGKVIILIPSTHGNIYLRMKEKAEKNNTWQAGYELPLATMMHLLPDEIDASNCKEYKFGYITQLHFLKYMFKSKLLVNLSIPFIEIVQRVLFFLENRPGYFLALVIEKK
ncbi:MAG: class I SAM-dependent methyltransferase, partial [Candidatus Delongbacteria bacterium]|nr:class I SAM-dependent methyltransferase [Candidatus Delongbacteria bacterium]